MFFKFAQFSFSVVLLFTPITSLCMDKSIVEEQKNFLAQQKPPSLFMRYLNKIVGPYITDPYHSKPAHEMTEKMWKEAQKDLGIPEEYHIPVKEFDLEKVDVTSKGSQTIIVAEYHADAMYYNPLNCFKHYGSQKQTLYHEAVHHKYLDVLDPYLKKTALRMGLFSMQTVIIGSLLAHELDNYFKHKKNFIRAWLKVFTGSALSISVTTVIDAFFLKKYLMYNSFIQERRADLESAYALKCSQCVEEVVATKQIWPKKAQKRIAAKGYLTSEQFVVVAHEHQRNGSICDYHKNL